CHQYNSDPRTF
nr:immunoglobulin light chain junction region [Macaca mulatta]